MKMNEKKKFCKNCGSPLAPDAKFCEGCGQQISAGSDHAAFSPPPGTKPEISASPQVGWPQETPPVRKSLLPLIITGAVILALGGLVGGYFWGKAKDTPLAPVAAAPPAMPTTEPPPQEAAGTPSATPSPGATGNQGTGFAALPPPPPLDQQNESAQLPPPPPLDQQEEATLPLPPPIEDRKIASAPLPLPPPVSGPDLPAGSGGGASWPWTSQRPVTSEDLSQLSPWQLVLMRNEIYARHGWVFHRADVRAHFEQQPWYQPKGTLDNRDAANRQASAELTPLERQNVKAILQYEQARRGVR